MRRRTFLTTLLGTPALAALLVACGDDSTGAPASTGGAARYLTGADDVVIRLGYEGGFVPVGANFVDVPNLLVSGDGRAFTPGATTLEFPGRLLPALNVRTINAAGIDKLLDLADDAGLLAPPPDYSAEIMVADAPDTVLVITTSAGRFEHRAAALGFAAPPHDDGSPADELTPARQKLWTFVQLISDLPAVAGAANLGAEQPFDAQEYRFQSMVTDESMVEGQDPQPIVLDWPADAAVRLADATSCGRSSENSVVSLLNEAKQNSVFRDGDVLYLLAAVAVLPGDPVC